MSGYVGKWNCTFHSGSQRLSFTATFAYTLGNNWMREIDSWPGGGDEGMYTYDASTRTWTSVVLDSGRGTTIFQAKETGTSTLVYHSVYPDTTMRLTIDRTSSKEYLVHFKQSKHGTVVQTNDTCARV